MTPSRMTPAPLALLLSLCLAAPALAGHRVVLEDGSQLTTSTRPVIALGRVSFHDATGRSVSLAASSVDIAATRRVLEATPSTSRVWTAADLAEARRTVRLETARTDGGQAESRRDHDTGPSIREASAAAAIRDYQATLDSVRERRGKLRGDHPDVDILEERQLVLQSEILRLETVVQVAQLEGR